MQYKIGTIIIIDKYFNGRDTSPIIPPSHVYGINIESMLIKIEDKYTMFDAWLCTKGILAVLIICMPSKLETIL